MGGETIMHCADKSHHPPHIWWTPGLAGVYQCGGTQVTQVTEADVDRSTSQEIKADDGKAPLHLLPLAALEEVAWVIEFGAEKYEQDSWRELPRSRQFAAALRHLFAWWRKGEPDEETGRSHLSHAASVLLEMLEQEILGQGPDDRPRHRGEGDE